MPTPEIARARAELRAHCDAEVLDDADGLCVYERNFGGMTSCTPALVVRPRCARDVLKSLRVAAQHDLTITVRGAGHCQSNQALGCGLILDMTELRRGLRVDLERELVEVEAGTTWRQVVDATYPLGLLPRGLTQIVDTTVAGTLSVAGIGGESFWTGPQVDNIAFLDVATLDGEVLRCNAEQHSELFDAVRAGLGQCAVVLAVGYRLRPCASRIETRGLVYRDGARFLQDAAALASQNAYGRFLTSSVASDPFDPTRRSLLLFVGQEECAEREPVFEHHADFELRTQRAPLWDSGGRPGHPFFHVFDAEARLNPWFEKVMSFGDAANALDKLLDARLLSLGSGGAGVRFMRRGAAPAPLFVTPPAELMVGVGVFASFQADDRSAAIASAARSAECFAQIPGKRYLSGYLARTAAEWAEHYGSAWQSFCRSKRRYDPQHRLNPGFVRWPD